MNNRLCLVHFAPILLCMLAFTPASAQRLVATVTVNMEKLPNDMRNKYQGLDKIVEAYINQRNWAPDDYGYDSNLDITIYFSEATPVSFEDRFKAQIVVSNRNDMQFNDKRWEFALQPGINLQYSTTFDPFRSTIDFYVFMALGFEFDKVKKFGGNPNYETARQIAQSARTTSRYFLGWDKREELVTETVLPENDHFRYLNFLYYTGEWLYYEERDREIAKKYLLYALKQLDRIKPERLQRFIDLNYYNYAETLSDYGEYSSLTRLASLDQNVDHADYYQRLLKKQ